ncbi:MAG TPA: hypothetical protein VG323_08465 [Thermoanaerobaculia bacterium]|nr:hypothetical protein [Thermoanaerobaculia bacterium]
MNHVFAIAGRELAEKRFIFVAAVAFAFVAALVSLMPGLHTNRAEAAAITSAILAANLALGLAAMLGATIVGRDIAAGRMSFYFARPVGGAAIWFGKLAAAAVLVAVAFTIAFTPALVAGPHRLANLFPSVGYLGAAALVLFFGGHTIGTMVRSRSLLIVFDFAAAVLTLVIAWLIVRPLLFGYAINAVIFLGKCFAAALLIAAIGAGTWQLVDGRSDRRRSHRAFSTVFWMTVAVALLAAALFAIYIVSATPADLHGRMSALQPPRGDAAIITGDARHRFDYRPAFLNGRRIDHPMWARFARDGQRAVLLEASPFSNTWEIVVRDAAHGWRAEQTKLVFPKAIWPIVANDDVSRIAVGDGGVVTVYDTVSSRALGSFRVPSRAFGWIFFVRPDLLRVYAADAVYEYDVASHALQKISDAASPRHLQVSPDGTRAIVLGQLCDARTLQPIGPADPNAHFLADGRVVTVPGFADEIAPGKVLVMKPPTLQVVDVDGGNVIASAEGLQPLPPAFWSHDPRPQLRNPNGFYRKTDGTLVRWNPLLRTAPEPAGRSRTGS